MTHPFLQGLAPTLHIAHRGGAKLAPENTLAAFEQAVERFQTQMLELDVHLSRDGEIVVCHDPTLERCTNAHGEVRDHTLTELQALDAGFRFSADGGKSFPFRGRGVRIPTLREVLRRFPGLRLNVELKADDPELERRFCELLWAEDAISRVCCGSELDAVGERLHALLPEACHFYPRSAGAEFVLSVRGGELPPMNERFTVLDLPAEFDGMWLIDEALVETARRLGKWINVWTVDAPEAMRRLIDLRVGGIMTDRPDLLRVELDARR